jgi:hypothetical protein
MHKALPNVKIVNATRQGVEPNDDMHAILFDCIRGDSLQVLLLVARVKGRARNFDPRSIGGQNTERIDANSGHLVDGGCVQERGIASLKRRTAVVSKLLAERLLISSSIPTDFRPPDRVVSLLFCEPPAQVGTVGLVCLPVHEPNGFIEGKVVRVVTVLNSNRIDREGALVMVIDGVAMLVSVGMYSDAKRIE